MITVSTTSATTNASNTTSNQNSQLSEATKTKLKALGIDPSTVSSEAQAQQLIENNGQTSFKNMVSQDNAQDSSSDSIEQEYLSEAQTLADRIGVSYNDDDSVSDILSAISNKLNQMMASAAMNPQQLQMVQYYQMELNNLSSNYSSAQLQAQAQSASNYKIQDS